MSTLFLGFFNSVQDDKLYERGNKVETACCNGENQLRMQNGQEKQSHRLKKNENYDSTLMYTI